MKTIIFRKKLAIGLIILFVGAFVVPSMAQATTIYVDDDNTSGPWDGTLEHPYQHIQDGIDNANSGDTVYVFNGTYYENVEADKTLNLMGKDKDSTIIDGGGSGSVVRIFADSVNISEFMIRNSGSEFLDAGISADYSYHVISENIIISNGGHGILINESGHYTISGNTITGNDSSGIYLKYCYSLPRNGIVSGNTITNNSWGIYLCGSRWGSIFNNTITNNSKDGIHSSQASAHYDVFNNNIINNGECGVCLWGAGEIHIVNNTVTDNNESGIYMSSIFCIIAENTITQNDFGIKLWDSIENTIYGNNITDNLSWGIYLEPAFENSIYHNNFIDNTQNAGDYDGLPDVPNIWDSGYPRGGNYWSDFHEPGQGAYDNNSDNIVDSPYIIPGSSGYQDRYPLVHPWTGTVLTTPNCGDANNDGTINSADVVYLINYLFAGGPEPLPGLCVGDCNNEGVINSADVVYLLNYLFAGGPAPEGCCKIIVCGDVTGDGLVNRADFGRLELYLYGGPAPDPLCAGDVNGDGWVDFEDADFLYDYLHHNGPPPVDDCCNSLK